MEFYYRGYYQLNPKGATMKKIPLALCKALAEFSFNYKYSAITVESVLRNQLPIRVTTLEEKLSPQQVLPKDLFRVVLNDSIIIYYGMENGKIVSLTATEHIEDLPSVLVMGMVNQQTEGIGIENLSYCRYTY
jgi:hypothetical protein